MDDRQSIAEYVVRILFCIPLILVLPLFFIGALVVELLDNDEWRE